MIFRLPPLSLCDSSYGEHVKLQSFRCSSADATDTHAPLALDWLQLPLSCSLPVEPQLCQNKCHCFSPCSCFSPSFSSWEGFPLPPGGGVQTSHSFLEPLFWSGKQLFCLLVFPSAPALQVSPAILRTGRSSQQVSPDTLYSKAPLPLSVLATPDSDCC